MTEFEKALQECLRDLERGASDVEACLRRYPGYASELEPILQTTAYLGRAREANLSSPFRGRVRTKLIRHMQAHPRRTARPGFPFVHRTATPVRLATGFAALLLAFLAAGTVYAQSALPGEVFYAWKLRSESAWRAVSPDPIETDLILAGRRVDELVAVSKDPLLYEQTLNAYLDIVDRLKTEADAESEARISAELNAQMEELNRSGIGLPQPGEEIPPLEPPTLAPPTTPTAVPLPILKTPLVEPTRLPQIVPTVQVPLEPTIEVPPLDVPPVEDIPEIVPTVQLPPLEDLPEVIPTVELPPLEDLPEIIPSVEIPPLLP
jgi:hypothetical protein